MARFRGLWAAALFLFVMGSLLPVAGKPATADGAVTVAVGDDFAAFEKRRPQEKFAQKEVPRDVLVKEGYACRTYIFEKDYQSYFLAVCFAEESKVVTDMTLTILPVAVDTPKIGRIMLSLQSFTLQEDGSFTMTTRP